MFDPGRHLTEDGAFVRPTLPNFNGFGAGPRLWCVAFAQTVRAQLFLIRAVAVVSPAVQLATYEFVATVAGILPFFDFVPSKAETPHGKALYQEPVMAESFTSSLAGPLWVDVRVRDRDALTEVMHCRSL